MMGRLLRMVIRLLRVAGALVLVFLLVLTGCQSRLIYFPRRYAAGEVSGWQRSGSGRMVEYRTGSGVQRAFLQSSRTRVPERLWVVTAGNGSLALDWSRWMGEHLPPEDACLLMDYPGYGLCEGEPGPRVIRENMRVVVPQVWAELGWKAGEGRERTRFFGHSLGAAAALLGADELGLRKGVLLAPFTSTMDMTRVVLGVPLGWLVWHRFDNEERLRVLAGRGGACVMVVHGDLDEVIPLAMSRRMAAEQPGVVHLTVVPGGRHNTLTDCATPQIEAAMREVRR